MIKKYLFEIIRPFAIQCLSAVEAVWPSTDRFIRRGNKEPTHSNRLNRWHCKTGADLKINKMKSLFLRAVTATLFVAVALLATSICRSQTIDRDQALQILADNGLEELSPGVWSLKGSQGNNFAIRKLHRMHGNKKIRAALHAVGGTLDIPGGNDAIPEFDSTIKPPPEAVEPSERKQKPQREGIVNPKPASAPKPVVLKIPSKENRKQALKNIQDAFEVEYVAATTPEKQKDLATVLSEFIQDEPSPAIRYVLFEEVYKLHAKSGDADNTFKTVDQLQVGFPDIDPLRYKFYGLKQIVSDLSGSTDGREAYQGLRPIIKSLFDLAKEKDDFKRALEVVQLNIEAAEKVKDRKALLSARKQLVEVDQLSKRYALVAAALKLLKENPLDAAANQTVGEWYCFEKQNWPEAIRYLAIGNNQDLVHLAKADLENPRDASEQVGIGDRYWELWDLWKADWERPEEAPALQARAVHWYQKAIPQLAGIKAKRPQTRLDAWESSQQQRVEAETEQEKPGDANGKAGKKKRDIKLATKPKYLNSFKTKAKAPLFSLMGVVGNQSNRERIGDGNHIYLHPWPSGRVSTISFRLKGQYKTFKGSVGVPNVRSYLGYPSSRITFSVTKTFIDPDKKPEQIFIVKRQRGMDWREDFVIDITGVSKLILETSCGGDPEGCFAFWFNPQVSPEEHSPIQTRSPQNFTNPNQSIRIPGQQQRVPVQLPGFPGQQPSLPGQ